MYCAQELGIVRVVFLVPIIHIIKFIELLRTSSWIQELVQKYYRENLGIAFYIMREKVETILAPTFIHQRTIKADNENADRVL